MCADHFQPVRFDLEVQGQGQMIKMANNLLNMARRAWECIWATIGFDLQAQGQGQMQEMNYNLLNIARRASVCWPPIGNHV